MDCRAALEILDCLHPDGAGPAGAGTHGGGPAEGSGLPEFDLQSAREHVAQCARCASIVERRRSFDRTIGRIVRDVDVPQRGLERLLASIAALDAVPARSGGDHENPSSDPAAVDPLPAAAPQDRAAPVPATMGLPVAVPPASVPSTPDQEIATVTRRRLWRGLLPLSACVVVAAAAFFGVVWLLTPRWTVDDVRRDLAGLDLETLQALPDFNGEAAAVSPPADANWENLEWCCGQTPKGAPPRSRHVYAIYGFVIQDARRGPIKGLLAVIPRHRVRGAPAAGSLAAVSSSEYVPDARLGESVSVAWTSGDRVCVCLLQGGADSLSLLQQRLDMPAA
jgi:hypothetical protein